MPNADPDGLYLYCMASDGCEPGPELAGVAGGPVRPVRRPRGTFWAERTETAPDPSLESVKRHHSVVDQAWRGCHACVPFRFGQWFADVEDADRALAEVAGDLAASLEKVAGCGEFSVRVVDPARSAGEVASSPVGSGRQYLERARRRLGVAPLDALGERVVREMEARLSGLVRETRAEAMPSRHGVVSLTHLVARTDEEAYLRAVAEVRSGSPDLRFLVSGPWPPYTFGP